MSVEEVAEVLDEQQSCIQDNVKKIYDVSRYVKLFNNFTFPS